MISADRLDVSQINFHATRMGNFFFVLGSNCWTARVGATRKDEWRKQRRQRGRVTETMEKPERPDGIHSVEKARVSPSSRTWEGSKLTSSWNFSYYISKYKTCKTGILRPTVTGLLAVAMLLTQPLAAWLPLAARSRERKESRCLCSSLVTSVLAFLCVSSVYNKTIRKGWHWEVFKVLNFMVAHWIYIQTSELSILNLFEGKLVSISPYLMSLLLLSFIYKIIGEGWNT